MFWDFSGLEGPTPEPRPTAPVAPSPSQRPATSFEPFSTEPRDARACYICGLGSLHKGIFPGYTITLHEYCWYAFGGGRESRR